MTPKIEALSTRADIDAAMTLFAEQIPDVVRSRIGHDDERTTRACASFLRRVVAPHVGTEDAVMIPHMWFGGYVSGVLVGAVHASALTTVAAGHIRGYGQGVEGMGTPPWIHRLLNVAAIVEEIAVVPSAQGEGVGRALLTALHARLREHRVPGPWGEDRAVHTFASSQAQSLFASMGYTVAPSRTVPPPTYVGGAPMLWDRRYDARDGAYCYGLLRDLS